MAKRVKFEAANGTWYFRQPQMGNTDTLAFQRINRTSRGGDLIVYRDDKWPITEVFGLTFDFDCEPPSIDFLNFLVATCGQEMVYTDHEGLRWQGVIQNPDAAIRQVSINSWQVSISFEGDQIA